MEAKQVIAFCLQMAFIKCTLARCAPYAAVPEVYAPVEFGMPTAFSSGLAMEFPMIPGPSFFISSDDLAVEGTITVCGSLPFLGTVGLEGELPATGQGTVMYNAGNGAVGIVREMPYAC